MPDNFWLRAADCPLLQLDAAVDSSWLRHLQCLLALGLEEQESSALVSAFLEEIGAVLHADRVLVVESPPDWLTRWQYVRRGSRATGEILPRSLLASVLDRESSSCQPQTGATPPILAAVVPSQSGTPRLLLISRSRNNFDRRELEYAVAACHYLSTGLERSAAWDERGATVDRLEALLAISRQLAAEREIPALLEHIAEQAARLLNCERASIFLWDRVHRQLVGRPALGLPEGELRIPDDAGIVGQVVRTCEPHQVDDVTRDPTWNPHVDAGSGFQTRNLLCVPLLDQDSRCLGAFEVLNKVRGCFTTADRETLLALASHTLAALENVREREALLRSNAQLEATVRGGAQIVGISPAISALRDTVQRVARTDLPVLVLGESGTGKEVVARTVHYGSPRQHQPFVAVNCAALTETLLESELFGYVKGAFTGADQDRQGRFELADGGTLFLDEIGDLSAGGQAKLLRVLEERVVHRVGGTQGVPVDTRIVAATNRNLAEAVRSHKFREDLFYRLTVVTIDLPPLRDRKEDILVLAEHFLEQFGRAAGRRRLKLTPESRRRLEDHPWAGNVRELRNLMERVAYLSPTEKVEVSDLAFILRPRAPEQDRFAELSLSGATESFQKEHIRQSIERAGGNMTDAAASLGLHRSNLYRKMRLLGMDTP